MLVSYLWASLVIYERQGQRRRIILSFHIVCRDCLHENLSRSLDVKLNRSIGVFFFLFFFLFSLYFSFIHSFVSLGSFALFLSILSLISLIHSFYISLISSLFFRAAEELALVRNIQSQVTKL